MYVYRVYLTGRGRQGLGFLIVRTVLNKIMLKKICLGLWTQAPLAPHLHIIDDHTGRRFQPGSTLQEIEIVQICTISISRRELNI
jgi:hypothetical protein